MFKKEFQNWKFLIKLKGGFKFELYEINCYGSIVVNMFRISIYYFRC